MRIVATHLPYVNSADLFEKVAHQPWAVFLDSGQLEKGLAVTEHVNFDVLAIKPQSTLVFDGEQTLLTEGAATECLNGDPLAILKSVLPTVENPEQHAYVPGSIGYFSYDLARYYEALPVLADDPESLPVMAVGIYHVVIVVDHKQQKTTLLQIEPDGSDTQAIAAEWQVLIQGQLNPAHDSPAPMVLGSESANVGAGCDGLVSGVLQENMSRADYARHFSRIREYTLKGDCYQVNLTKQFSVPADGEAWPTYRYLREKSPAPYGAFMHFPFATVLSNSPESFIQCRDRQVTTSPIKGTSPRNHLDLTIDKANADALLNSPKDRAENLMIVDLMRNDLSRCCELGSVTVPKLFEVHSFANVHHLISRVCGVLNTNTHALDLLRSCFPGGSITGAPKIRAMQIIEELEPTRRGLYCGAIGYIGVDGNLETSIAIRTIVVKDGVARYSAGGGLVVDSEEESEYQELLDKSKMMKKALFRNSSTLS